MGTTAHHIKSLKNAHDKLLILDTLVRSMWKAYRGSDGVIPVLEVIDSCLEKCIYLKNELVRHSDIFSKRYYESLLEMERRLEKKGIETNAQKMKSIPDQFVYTVYDIEDHEHATKSLFYMVNLYYAINGVSRMLIESKSMEEVEAAYNEDIVKHAHLCVKRFIHNYRRRLTIIYRRVKEIKKVYIASRKLNLKRRNVL